MKRQTVNISLDIEKLPEGYYLATSPDVRGLVAQEKLLKVVETAKELASILLELDKEVKEFVVSKTNVNGFFIQ